MNKGRIKMAYMVGIALILAAGLALVSIARDRTGSARFFKDQSYHFQTLRALSDIPFDGADTGEVLQTIQKITEGDEQSWFAAWEQTGARVLEIAKRTKDPANRGRAMLRAHNYFRTAEFFLPPDDPKRPITAAKNIMAFYDGLDAMGVKYERLQVPYGKHHLPAVYYPGPAGSDAKPLLVFAGGFDSTLEELYFVLVADAHEHGYSVLTYEGPGQGSVIREQGLPFTHEWEKPTTAVLDAFLAKHATKQKLVLIGMSLGGYFAPRAAAFEPRFDGVVAFDVFYSVPATNEKYVPKLAFWLYDNGFKWVIDGALSMKSALNPSFRWAMKNGMWVMNTSNPIETVRAFRNYTLEPVASRIKADVLILAGADDHFVPVEQVEQFKLALTNARSVTTAVYGRESGGSEHCQLGAVTLWHATFFDWVKEKFPPSGGGAEEPNPARVPIVTPLIRPDA